jgi:dolichyl-phosphate-mannose-protein mannosyltransferase
MKRFNLGTGLADLAVLVLLCTLAGLSLGYRITQPEMLYFDEIYFVPSAREILGGGGLGEVTHPPLGKLLIAISIRLFGDAPFAWRLPSLLSGIALVGIVVQLVRGFGASLGIAALAGALLILDGVCITQARIGLVNAPCVALGFGALLCATRGNPLGAGALLGLSCACKFVGFAFAPLVPVLLLVPEFQDGRHVGRQWWRVMLTLIAALAFYLVAFAPVLIVESSFWKGMLLYHKAMLEHHLMQAVVPHRYESSWWTWPISLRPIWFGFEAIPGTSLVRGIFCIANPVTSLVVLVGIGFLFVRGILKRAVSRGEAVAMAGFFLQLLPWAFSPRITMYHYYYPALVFGVVIFCLQIVPLKPAPKFAVITALALAAGAMFLYWYPLWSALPIPRTRYESMIWFQGWT